MDHSARGAWCAAPPAARRVLFFCLAAATVLRSENLLSSIPQWTVAKLYQKPNQFSSFGLALSEKQIPQIVENNESRAQGIEPLEATGVRPRQVRYQAALRPDMTS
jgi:hypothetical protein